MSDTQQTEQPAVVPGLLPWSELTTTKARAFKIVFTVVGALPLWANHLLGNALGVLMLVIPNRHRRVTRQNLAICFPQAGPVRRFWWLLRSLQESCKGITEMAAVWTKPPSWVFSKIREIRGIEVLDEPLAQQRPVLFGAPHLGCWELLNLYLSSRTRCAMLYREPHDAGVEAFIRHSRQRMGAKLIRANASGVRQMIKRLRAGDLVGILPDHQPRRGQGEFSPFFGPRAYTMVLLPKLIHHAKADMVFGYAERLSFGRGYRIHLRGPDPAMLSDNIETACAAMNATVEAMARENFLQYEWSYKRFAMRPNGSFFEYGSDGLPFSEPGRDPQVQTESGSQRAVDQPDP